MLRTNTEHPFIFGTDSKVEEGFKAATLALARLKVQRADAQQEAKVTVPGPGIRADLPPVLPTQPAQNYAPGLAGPQAVTVAQVFDEFMDMQKTENDEDTYSFSQDKLATFYERFATRPIRSLTYEEGLAYKRWLQNDKPWRKGKTKMKGLGPTSVNHYMRAAKTLLNWAVEHEREYLDRNPWKKIKFMNE